MFNLHCKTCDQDLVPNDLSKVLKKVAPDESPDLFNWYEINLSGFSCDCTADVRRWVLETPDGVDRLPDLRRQPF